MKKHDTWPSVAVTRIGLLVGAPIAILLGTSASTWAAVPIKTWTSGETLTAADLNTNLASLQQGIATLGDAMVDRSSDQTIAGAKTFTGNVKVEGALKTGYQFFNGSAGTPAQGCARFVAGVYDCTCPVGTVAIAGGVYTPGNVWIAESRPIGPMTFRFACKDSTGAATDCPYHSFTCARLAAD